MRCLSIFASERSRRFRYMWLGECGVGLSFATTAFTWTAGRRPAAPDDERNGDMLAEEEAYPIGERD